MMKLSNTGEQLIKNFEGLRLKAYQDDAGVWTIGYGSTQYADGRPVKPGEHLTDKQVADQLFRQTLTGYEQAVNTLVKVPISQHQFDALVSFTYNAGTGALKASTLLKYLNQSSYSAAANQFLKWNKVTDKQTRRKVVSAGLSERRERERALFLS
ncbi:lysozyme [Mucilaginibacter sp.]